ncbi:MAG: phosphatidate cytidylyltransferase [Pacificimonas sp.]|jgi:phosphatidate cytidylyltransferase|nr:phosphatidate cytidylyltransferase [Pacificimonas sp.]
MAASDKLSLRVRYRDLQPRVIVGLLLIAVALLGGWQGGLIFNFLIGVAALLMFREWARMHGLRRSLRLGGFIGLGAAVVLANESLFWLALGAVAATAAVYFRQMQVAIGALYCGIPAVALIWLRGQEAGYGLLIWTLAIVWATDIGAYFAGRTIGGPKLAPSISPSKTWAGLFGGMAASALIGGALTLVFTLPFSIGVAAALAAGLAVAAQAGDFYESAVKRRAGVKDSGNLLPGHGGVLDRLDGLVPVSILVAGAVWVGQL